MQDVNQAFLTKKKFPQNTTDVVSSSVSSSSSECSLSFAACFFRITFPAVLSLTFTF